MDGGIRRGSDVVKTLALGARTIMIGRALVAPGRPRRAGGHREVPELFRSGIRRGLRTVKASSTHDVHRRGMASLTLGVEPGAEVGRAEHCSPRR
ncbi:alpha-hydroxy-acid oxidizing protein [Blastococcus sp. TF02-9]|uniref:alpha-hydroxy-acid oxidizing protein n=1 Tax=Blastococcus sp. TF02-09 TaxID=2250576 RepID=UPI001F189083|nr:alpha-hydroxy-acid oxidizing protein [Blastococcus sp. TF02-9]